MKKTKIIELTKEVNKLTRVELRQLMKEIELLKVKAKSRPTRRPAKKIRLTRQVKSYNDPESRCGSWASRCGG